MAELVLKEGSTWEFLNSDNLQLDTILDNFRTELIYDGIEDGNENITMKVYKILPFVLATGNLYLLIYDAAGYVDRYTLFTGYYTVPPETYYTIKGLVRVADPIQTKPFRDKFTSVSGERITEITQDLNILFTEQEKNWLMNNIEELSDITWEEPPVIDLDNLWLKEGSSFQFRDDKTISGNAKLRADEILDIFKNEFIHEKIVPPTEYSNGYTLRVYRIFPFILTEGYLYLTTLEYPNGDIAYRLSVGYFDEFEGTEYFGLKPNIITTFSASSNKYGVDTFYYWGTPLVIAERTEFTEEEKKWLLENVFEGTENFEWTTPNIPPEEIVPDAIIYIHDGIISGTGDKTTRENEITADNVAIFRNFSIGYGLDAQDVGGVIFDEIKRDDGTVEYHDFKAWIDVTQNADFTTVHISDGIGFAYGYFGAAEATDFTFLPPAVEQYHLIYLELDRSVVPNTAKIKTRNNQGSSKILPNTFRKDVLTRVKTGVFEIPLWIIRVTNEGISRPELATGSKYDLRQLRKYPKHVNYTDAAYHVQDYGVIGKNIFSGRIEEGANDNRLANTVFVYNAIIKELNK